MDETKDPFKSAQTNADAEATPRYRNAFSRHKGLVNVIARDPGTGVLDQDKPSTPSKS